jgi:DNA repair protein RecN (Recombination protein N)
MLTTLHIENIAVIEQADIEFGKGFHVLTGETGAGKSIIIDAISAILGERAYRESIRTGAQRATVRAVFSQVPAFAWFAENGVENLDGEVLIQRDIHTDGKNVCRVNGVPVTVAILRQLGMQLISIHGQHDSQQLFDEASHLTFLDLYAADDSLLEAYRSAYAARTALAQEIDRLSMDESEKLRRTEMLRHQIAEIERAALQPGEDTELEARRKLLQNGEKLMDGLAIAQAALDGADEMPGAAALLSDAARALGRLSSYGEKLGELSERLQSLMYDAADLGEEVQKLQSSFAYSAEELEQVESRLDLIHRLRKKYGVDCEEILSYLESAKQELDEMEYASDRIAQLQEKLKKADAAAEREAMALRSARQAAASRLEKQLCEELRQLDMPGIVFSCQFSQVELSPNGMDQVRFLMSANAGEALKPLSKVASGGELARIMLAMKNVLAERDAIATLIFDEVDAGVSGRAAQKVAEKLRAVSRGKQVLCVTHLPQIAAMADAHYLISKAQRNGRTYTEVIPLDRAGRIQELARLIGGAEITDTTRKSAEEMLHDQ